MRREPFPLLSELPPELKNVILDFHWDVALLHRLELPVVELRVAELAWQLRLPFWAWDGRPFQVTPLEVAAEPEVYAEQYARTMAADLRYPLDVVRRPDGRITILDGVHRLLRAHLDRLESVRARVLEWEELDAIAVRR
ncbi:ParB-like nuclease family protein [Kribbella steppae]|uniref:ParB-like nuclease family protein n=1 Tax=Kribbella steppae TaxID=2512223 RepID=A0A4R2HBP8_9ACTN|nr:ParB N-terminal domain-containing protein [Kribbella steppae]TCO24741.1 ParB-like nuclease family protein [Kribbella steppae]